MNATAHLVYCCNYFLFLYTFIAFILEIHFFFGCFFCFSVLLQNVKILNSTQSDQTSIVGYIKITLHMVVKETNIKMYLNIHDDIGASVGFLWLCGSVS